jgi:DNA-binding transcriptional LysR family regulator
VLRNSKEWGAVVNRLDAMGIFVEVIDKGSLSAAARSLRVSLPTVSRVLTSLETELGVRLLVRSTRGFRETECGQLYYDRCRKIMADVRLADREAQGLQPVPTGELRITAPVLYGQRHVAPVVARFLDLHPKVSADLLLNDQIEPLAEQRIDVAVRVGGSHSPRATVRSLGFIQRVVVASTGYLEHHAAPVKPRDLVHHNCLLFTHYFHADEWRFRYRGRDVAVPVGGRMRTNNQEALLQAVLAGAGVALLPDWLVRTHVASGLLTVLLDDCVGPRTPVHAVFPTSGSQPRTVRAFVDLLADHYRRERILPSRA